MVLARTFTCFTNISNLDLKKRYFIWNVTQKLIIHGVCKGWAKTPTWKWVLRLNQNKIKKHLLGINQNLKTAVSKIQRFFIILIPLYNL